MKYIYVSHSFKHQSDYERLINLLNDKKYFNFQDYSVNEGKKVDTYVWRNIKNHIKCCSIFIICAGLYSSYSDSILTEIDIAQNYNKPILAIKPRGNIQTTKLTDFANEEVSWNTDSIVDAIRRLC